MRAARMFTAVDSHTEGMPTRVITAGVGTIPGATMNERRLYFIEPLDDIRLLLMNEPRGHAAMSGAILQPPTRPDADVAKGHIFFQHRMMVRTERAGAITRVDTSGNGFGLYAESGVGTSYRGA